MDDRNMTERYQDATEKAHATAMDAKYRKMAEDYAKAHRDDAQKEPEPETDREKMRRWMGLPPKPAPSPNTILGRERQQEQDILHRFMGITK